MTSLSGLSVGSTPVTSTAWIWLTWLEDGIELARVAVQLVVGQCEPGQTGEVGYLISGDLRHDKASQVTAGAHLRRRLAGMLSPLWRSCATVLRVPSYLLRVQLEDRPGSLGSLAVALGSVGADILSLDVVERGAGYAIDDLVVELPPGAMPDMLITAAENPSTASTSMPSARTPGCWRRTANWSSSTMSPRPTGPDKSGCRSWWTRRPGCYESDGAP